MTTARALITGVGGSIGCHVLTHLLHNTDWDIVGLDSFRHKGLTDRIVEITKQHPEWAGRWEIHTHDLTAPISPQLALKLGDLDYIINMASLSDVDASLEQPADFIHANVQIATTMLDFTRRFHPNLTAFIQISTDEVYGPSTTDEGHAEWSPILPSNPYAASKACQEAIAISYWRSFGVPVIITNTMNNFGEMQQASKFPAIVQRKVTAGQKIEIHGSKDEIGSRFYLHSRNFADALLFLLREVKPHTHVDGHADWPDRFNIVGDRRVDNLELAKLIAKVLDRELNAEIVDFHKFRPGHDRHYGLRGEKLAQLGWKPPRSFEDSLRSTIEWTQAHPEWLDT